MVFTNVINFLRLERMTHTDLYGLMKSKTHIELTQEILKKFNIYEPRIRCYAVHADLNRNRKYPGIPEEYRWNQNYGCLQLDYQDFKGLELDHHHDTFYDIYMIEILTKLALESNKRYGNFYDALFHFCNAFHYLCDSAIPRLPFPEIYLDRIEEKFDSILIDNQGISKDEKQYDLNKILNTINFFIKDMPVKTLDEKFIKKTKIKIFRNGLILANHVFR